MTVSLTFTDLEPDEAQALLALLSGNPTVTVQTQGHQAPPPNRTPPPTGSLVPPPPNQAPAPQPENPLMAAATKAMTAYVGVHKVTGARKVLNQIGHSKIGDVTDPGQLQWLVQAFSDLNYVPPG